MSIDYEKDLLLVTAASGKQSTHLLPLLTKQWKRLRLQVNSLESRDRLAKQYPDAEVVQTDMADPHACRKLLEGVTACFLITPGFHPQETYCGYNIIDAAAAQLPGKGNFKHLVYSSVIFPEKTLLVNHDAKRYVQEHLIQSEMPYTILQPTVLMENVPIAKIITSEDPVHTMLWNPGTKFTFVSCRDVGQAAANVLSEREKHYYATYQLSGTPSPLNFTQAMSIVSSEIGKEVKIEQKPIEEGVKMFSGLVTKGEPDKAPFETKQGVARMFMYYNDKGLIGNANVLEMLLDRKPLGYREWVKVNLEESGKGSGGGGAITRSTAMGMR